VTARPVSAASLPSSTFHSRLRSPLDPPASAVTSSLVACGSAWEPTMSHQRRIVATAEGGGVVVVADADPAGVSAEAVDA
jgi:hypothetical protein